MDDLDLNILLQLLQNARQSYNELARHLKESPFVVRKRVERLHEMGVIAKFATSLNPALFGKSACFTLARVKAGSDQSAIVEKLSRNPEVVGAVTSLENMVQVITLYGNPEELNANVERIKSLDEVEGIENYMLLMPGPAPPPVKIPNTGWRITAY